ncbi:MAG: cysteine synthase family protein [FCB group bacterium]|nr:cysteine synthase family protein [FCB group bacterium]
MDFFKDNLDLIGNTPLLEISDNADQTGPLILAKLEYFNPGGSTKDRIAKYIIEKALLDGTLKKGDTVIDNTSGNTGIALAMVAAGFDLKAILTTPEKTSQEKVDTIRALGAEVIITPTDAAWDDPRSCYQVARRMAEENGYYYFNQYDNPENIMAHYHSTGPEIWRQTEGKITHLVAGIGTGGTLSGTARYLKEQNPEIKSIAVDPSGSLFTEYIKTGRAGASSTYMVEGIGSDMVTGALDTGVIDDIITVGDEDSFATARRLARRYGILAGGSSGTAAYAAFQVARSASPEAVIVTIFSDSAVRYISKCFSDRWMIEHGFGITEKEKA